MFWMRTRDPSVGIAVAHDVAFVEGRIVGEVIEELTDAQLVVLA
jgi:hypothetical protein